MIHLGDITKINGRVIKPVNVITFGAPCQDLSMRWNSCRLSHRVAHPAHRDSRRTITMICRLIDGGRMKKEKIDVRHELLKECDATENAHGSSPCESCSPWENPNCTLESQEACPFTQAYERLRGRL